MIVRADATWQLRQCKILFHRFLRRLETKFKVIELLFVLASVAVATQRIEKRKKKSIMLCGKFIPNRYQMELKKKKIAIFKSLKSLVVPVIWLALIGAIYSRIAPFLALNRIFFAANEEATPKTKQPFRFQGLFKVISQIAGKWKTKSIIWQI